MCQQISFGSVDEIWDSIYKCCDSVTQKKQIEEKPKQDQSNKVTEYKVKHLDFI